MAEQQRHQAGREHQRLPRGLQSAKEGVKGVLPDKGPSGSKVLALATLFPVGGTLLALSGMILTGTIVGLAVTTPLFVIFSPVLVPAAIVIGLAVTGFLAAGALGLTAVSSLSWILKYVRGGAGGSSLPEQMEQQMEQMKRRMAEAAGHVGQRTKDVGQGIQSKAQEASGRQ